MTMTNHPMPAALVFEPSMGWLGGLAILLGVAAVIVAYTVSLRWRESPASARALLLACRLGAVLCLVVALLHPAWVSEKTTDQRPVLAVLVDDSASMGRPTGEPDAGAGHTRYAKAADLLKARIAPALDDTHQLRLFDVRGRELDRDRLPEKPAETSSPLTQSLLRIQRELTEAEVFNLAGIVLLSDGAETPDGQAAGDLARLRVPVHAVELVAAEPQAGAPDLAIQAVSAGHTALVGNTVQIAVDITGSGQIAAGTVPLTVLEGERTVATRAVPWRAGESAVRVPLEFTPRRAGEFTYTVQLGGVTGEVTLDNNRETFPLTVRAKPLTVVYVDGVLRWEGKFLKEALTGDPDINLISAVRTARPGADRGSQGILLAEQLANVNLVILGDVEAAYFSADEIKALKAWVTEKQGALVLTGGYHTFGPEGLGRSDLRDILPAEFGGADPQIEQPFSLKLTEAGRECPVFRLSGDRVRDSAFWQSLPQLSGCSRIAALKPGAEVLAVNPSAAGPDGTEGLPVMIVQQVGTGRAMILAVDTTWKWRMVMGGYTGETAFYPRFWGQLVRWMVGYEDQPRQQLYVTTDRQRCKPGESVEVSIVLRNPGSPAAASQPATAPAVVAAASQPAGAWRVTAHALDEKGGRLSIPLAAQGGGRYRGTLAAARPGRMDIAVAAESLAGESGGEAGVQPEGRTQSQVVTVQVERPDLELIDPRPNPQWLAQAAQLTGGRTLKPDQIDDWARGLPRQKQETRTIRSASLWHHPALAAVFFGLLCTEWLLRRRSRLA